VVERRDRRALVRRPVVNRIVIIVAVEATLVITRLILQFA
jgi:hypothetical protein